ncbi:hypothetical protein [Aliikangiella marina]|uniref:hypothetical protein n=1 Tax=Aliikangiella marina TaxID=1712262 RepID=UPI00163DDD21|nr:hypothetical protein [Aliikangiella marina]
MQGYWPKDENIMSWDPENMDKYWAMCQKYDKYPKLEPRQIETASREAFKAGVKQDRR